MKDFDYTLEYVLHYFPFEKFTNTVVNFFNKNYSNRKNIFLIYGDKKNYIGNFNELKAYSNVLFSENLSKYQETELIKKSRKLILHCLNWKILIKLSYIYNKNIYVVFWGGDIESYKPYNIKDIKGKIRFLVSRHFVKKVIPITFIENDYLVLKDTFNIDFKENFVARYLSEQYSNQLLELPYACNHDTIRVLLGNSATKTNNHKEIIDKLSKFKDKNIAFYIPLSYGEVEYGQEIENYAIDMLGSKVHPITEFLNPEEYNKFLNSIDIGIFNYHRQQGLGNINRLLLLRKKVYINTKSGLYNYYKNQGIQVYDIEDISSKSFENFISYDKEALRINRDIQIESLSNATVVKEWNDIIGDN